MHFISYKIKSNILVCYIIVVISVLYLLSTEALCFGAPMCLVIGGAPVHFVIGEAPVCFVIGGEMGLFVIWEHSHAFYFL
jgi:hypothetical protein